MMEEERRKKKNKKKKNKQNKATNDSASSMAHANSKDQNGVIPEQDHQSQPIETHSVIHQNHSNGERKTAERDGADSNGTVFATRENQDWLKEEAALKEMIKQLQVEKESRVQKEVDLERKVGQLQGEKDSWRQKEVDLEMKVRHLQGEKDSWHQKEVDLEMKVRHLQGEKDSWQEKEIGLDEKIGQLMQEKAALRSEEKSLQEKVKALEKERVSCIRKEILDRETITALNDDTTRLWAQVIELEESKRKLSLENQQMADNLSTLQLRIDDLERSFASPQSSVNDIPKEDESKIENLNSEIEAACALVEKLVTENAELVEKVNELNVELARWNASKHEASSSVFVPNSLVANVNDRSCPVSEPSKGNNISTVSAEQSDRALLEDERIVRDHSDLDYSADMVRNSSETSVSGEIVQIPLDENEVLDLEGQALINREDEAVPLTDAPLIGAPFRLISFVTSYVSGADLVDKNLVNEDSDPGQ